MSHIAARHFAPLCGQFGITMKPVTTDLFRVSLEVNVENRTLYHGDNLEFLRGMNSGMVHLIATDPPFNKNRDFHATPDSLAAGARFSDRWRWDKDVHPEWEDQIKDDPEDRGS